MSNHQIHTVRTAVASLETVEQGAGPAVVIVPSYGRGTGADYDRFSERVAAAGFRVLRPQPRGIAGSTGPMHGVTLHDLAADVVAVVDQLAGGHAHLLGHAFGGYVVRVAAIDRPDAVSSVILAAAQGPTVPDDVAATPMTAGDPEASKEDRLAALRLGFFAPDHDPSGWLAGWYPEVLAMEVGAIEANDPPRAQFLGAGRAPVLELIAAEDPFHQRQEWGSLRRECGDRVTSVIIPHASHALFPEQPDAVADAMLAHLQPTD